MREPWHRPEDDLGREAEAAEGPGVGHGRCSRMGWQRERRSYPLTTRRSTQRNLPGFRGVPDAAKVLAAYIHSAAERALGGERL